MKKILFGCFLAGLFTISCKKDERPTYLKDDTSPSVAANNVQKPSLIDQAGIQSTNVQTGSTMVTAPGMNPPHGQPNHRCDIPVGQPLNSAPAPAATNANPNAQNITVNGNNTIQIDPNSVSPGKIVMDQNGKQVKTAPGMNPPHGQPNHRCDIPVGQPLNSKPMPQANATQNAPQPMVVAPQLTPAPQAVANTGPKPANNPAHGQPWHDCAKQVGAPL